MSDERMMDKGDGMHDKLSNRALWISYWTVFFFVLALKMYFNCMIRGRITIDKRE